MISNSLLDKELKERLRVIGDETELPVFVYSYEFDLLLIEMLEPNNLPQQYYFGTSKAVAMLKLTGRHELK